MANMLVTSCVVSYDISTILIYINNIHILWSALLKNALNIVLTNYRDGEQIQDGEIRSCGSSERLFV